MPHRLPRSARLALTGIKVTLVASIAITGLATQPDEPGTGYTGYTGYAVNETPSRDTRLFERHDCSATGFADATPLSAIIRTPGGRSRHVSFETGWDVYSRHGAAKLIAVCLDEAPS
jgi:hypothetical protein